MFHHKNYINLHYYQYHQKSLVMGSCQIHGNRCRFSKILIIYWKLKLYHWQQILSVVALEVTGSRHSFLRNWQTLKPQKKTVENTFVLSSKNYVLWEKKAYVYFSFCHPEYFCKREILKYIYIYAYIFFKKRDKSKSSFKYLLGLLWWPVAKTLHSQCRGPGFIPWSGT